MIRFALLFLLVAAGLFLLWRIAHSLKTSRIDWRGIGIAAGFIALALFLNHRTGMGWAFQL